MTICTKYHEDITLKTINVNPLVTQGEKSEEYQCQRDSSSGDLECLYKSSWQSIQQYLRYFCLGIAIISTTWLAWLKIHANYPW